MTSRSHRSSLRTHARSCRRSFSTLTCSWRVIHRCDSAAHAGAELRLRPAWSRCHLKGNLVNATRNIIVMLMLAAVASAVSAQQGKTRAQVEAELAAAIRNGDMPTNGELGLRQREQRPDLYPSTPVAAKTRAQVEAELADAVRDGDMIAAGESGVKEKDLRPASYPADPAV